MDKSLDEVIAERSAATRAHRGGKGGPRAGRNNAQGGAGPVRRTMQNREARRVATGPYVGSNTTVRVSAPIRMRGGAGQGGSILSRVGDRANAGTGAGSIGGTKVVVTNLNYDIMQNEVQELFASIGELKTTPKLLFDRSGRSLGQAEVIFARRSDALNAVKKFNGRTLDGTPMEVKLAGEGGKPNPFNPVLEEEEYEAPAHEGNVREGLFGTALADEDDFEDGEFSNNWQPRGGRRGGRGRGRGFRRVIGGDANFLADSTRDVQFSVILNGGEQEAYAESGERWTRGRGKGRGRGRGRGPRERNAPKTAEELDAELDEFHAGGN